MIRTESIPGARRALEAGSRQKRNYPLVQALRALAALAVAFSHISGEGVNLSPGAHWLARINNSGNPWNGGVDVFFVISGFVIASSSQALFGQSGAASIFLKRRLARIVPLYWTMTTLFLLTLWFLPEGIHGDIGGAGYILATYFFIPAARPDGVIAPVMKLGWSLNFEMFFYLVFTPFLRFSQMTALISVAGLLVVFVLLGQIGFWPGTILNYLAQPVVLEFCGGIFLAGLPGRLSLSGAVRIALTLAAIAWFFFFMDLPREFGRGIPAIALVVAAITGPQEGRLPKLEIWLSMLGDASYALYLVHPFMMRIASLFWNHMHHHLGGVSAYLALCLVFSQIAAILIHRWFERPVTSGLRRWLEPRRARPLLAFGQSA